MPTSECQKVLSEVTETQAIRLQDFGCLSTHSQTLLKVFPTSAPSLLSISHAVVKSQLVTNTYLPSLTLSQPPLPQPYSKTPENGTSIQSHSTHLGEEVARAQQGLGAMLSRLCLQSTPSVSHIPEQKESSQATPRASGSFKTLLVICN